MTVMMDAFAVRGRSPQGKRGLKWFQVEDGLFCPRRSPQGERGLKSIHVLIGLHTLRVAPRKGSVD